jgi:hypothetical protein
MLYFERVSFVDCKIVERSDKKIILKRTQGTFDPSEYGVNVYLIASSKMVEELNTLADSKNIDISEAIYITIQYNKLIDIKKKKDAVYINIRKIIDIEKSDHVSPL